VPAEIGDDGAAVDMQLDQGRAQQIQETLTFVGVLPGSLHRGHALLLRSDAAFRVTDVLIGLRKMFFLVHCAAWHEFGMNARFICYGNVSRAIPRERLVVVAGTKASPSASFIMTDRADRHRPGAEADHAPAKAGPCPEDLEKLRLRFELELFESQNADASLDPLLRPKKTNGHAEAA
jgi:hypothetical protein